MNRHQKPDEFSDDDIAGLFDQQDVDVPARLSDKIRTLAASELGNSGPPHISIQDRFKALAPVFAGAAVLVLAVAIVPLLQLYEQPELPPPARISQETTAVDKAEAPAAGAGAGSDLTRLYRNDKQTWLDELQRLFEVGEIELLAEELAEFKVEHGTDELVRQLPVDALLLLPEH